MPQKFRRFLKAFLFGGENETFAFRIQKQKILSPFPAKNILITIVDFPLSRVDRGGEKCHFNPTFGKNCVLFSMRVGFLYVIP